jgi:hypothetical protein
MPISDLTKEQFEKYANESSSWKELMTKCGYTNFGCRTYLKKKLSNNCIDCTKQIYDKATRCVECHLINSRKVERPSYEQLLKDKETLNMVQIGKKYNVSDNTIRKWIKRYKNINNILD